ncbi:MAG: hypothetical protein H6713_32650 [Myxococcales bacterium]|nr:hypothetical protein [Myxococcales bacterium]
MGERQGPKRHLQHERLAVLEVADEAADLEQRDQRLEARALMGPQAAAAEAGRARGEEQQPGEQRQRELAWEPARHGGAELDEAALDLAPGGCGLHVRRERGRVPGVDPARRSASPEEASVRWYSSAARSIRPVRAHASPNAS